MSWISCSNSEKKVTFRLRKRVVGWGIISPPQDGVHGFELYQDKKEKFGQLLSGYNSNNPLMGFCQITYELNNLNVYTSK